MSEPSAFDPAHFNTMLLIQLARIYDLQLALVTLMDEDLGARLSALHEQGQLLGPPPALAVDDEPE